MATPEETRDRIKEMRDRIFKDSGKKSTETNIQEIPKENDLTENNLEVLQTIKDPSNDAKPATPQAKIFSKKLEQDDDRISLLNADTQKQISEIAREFASKIGILEAAILDKLEHNFAESNSKIDDVENLVNNSNLSSSQAIEVLKEELKNSVALFNWILALFHKDFLPQIKRLKQNFKTILINYRILKILLRNVRIL